jgi:diaminopropionate ammonia-lyase
MRFVTNSGAQRGPYTSEEAQIICIGAARRALAQMRTWSGYEASPLRELTQLAARLGLASLHCKDEANRFGLGSFKALGGAYAAGLAVQRLGVTTTSPTLCCATDGNHGRSVAFGARRLGCHCVVFMHERAPEHKAMAMRALGAEVRRVAGNYDDSVHHAKQVASENGWLLISDTADTPFDLVAAEVMHGYGVMALETLEQLKGRLPTHLIMQAGVGGLAAAIAGCLAEVGGAERPVTLVVEPETAACVMESARDGGPSRIHGDLATNMAMLSCGETSAPAWVVLQRRADAFISVSDDAAAAAVTVLREAAPGQSVRTSPSGAAGLAGLIAAVGDQSVAARLGIDAASRVLIFATEGDEGGGTPEVLS